jgi:hypothetical protein
MEQTMSKKIAVVVRDRQSEALRMAIGLILMDDIIDVYVLDGTVESTEQNQLNLETMQDMDMKAYSNVRENDTMEYLTIEEIAGRLPHYDHVLAY